MFSERLNFYREAIRRSTPQIRKPALIGGAVLLGIAVLAVLGLGNTDNPLAMPSTLGGIAVSQAIWGLKPSNLLMVLPIGAFLVVLARSFIGMKAFGLFTPMLIALAFLQIGPLFGPLVMICAIGSGMIVAPSLLKLRMTRVGFLGVLISLVVFILAALQGILDTQLQVDAFPVVVTALCVERWWRQWEKDGAYEAAKLAANTLVLALAIEFVMVSHLALALMEVSPMLLPGFAAVAITILGRYRGLRLTEIGRFLPIWWENWQKRRGITEDPAQLEEVTGILAARHAIDEPWVVEDHHAVKMTVFPRLPPAPGQRPLQVPIAANAVDPAPAMPLGKANEADLIVDSAAPEPRVGDNAAAAIDWGLLREELNETAPGGSNAQPIEFAEIPIAAFDWPESGGFAALFARRSAFGRLIDPAVVEFAHAGRRNPWHQSQERDHRQVQSAQGDRPGARQGGNKAGAAGERSGHHQNNLRGLQLWRA